MTQLSHESKVPPSPHHRQNISVRSMSDMENSPSLYMAKQPRHTGTRRRGCIFSFPVISLIPQAVHPRVVGSLTALTPAAWSAPIAGWIPTSCVPSTAVLIKIDPMLPAWSAYPGGHPIGCGASGLRSPASAGRSVTNAGMFRVSSAYPGGHPLGCEAGSPCNPPPGISSRGSVVGRSATGAGVLCGCPG